MNDKPKRVLFVNGLPIDIGGVEKAIMDVYRGIDRNELLIDFAVRKPQEGYFHDEIRSYGGRILNIFENTKHKGNKRWNFMMDLYSVFSFYRILKTQGPFCAVHIPHPILDGLLIIAAKMAGIPVIIAYSNNTGIDDKVRPGFFRILLRKLRLLACRRFATHLWGCSKAACRYSFGDKVMEDDRAEVVPYPVSISSFKSKTLNKEQACNELNIQSDNIIFINVGRYAPQKNQLFLLEFFSEMLKRRKDLHLLLTGPGPLENEIVERIRVLNIDSSVTMLDSHTSIPLALNASDYFLLPSIYEGFGIVLIEAQAAGITCFASDACQPEADLGLIDYIPLDKGAKYWAEYILSSIEKPEHRIADGRRLDEYDISIVAPRIQSVYLTGVKYKNSKVANEV